ncbi:HAD-IC family P-type ATPase [Microbacterium candidum]|uniref:HAD-IC family P-type ATPase n=1 Tax=Microbacterium candidum TaxID=3041922 RepID=A0ABT7N3W7_9MICO|nr:HAD-IC family P-type ATPase [Microbacterium sp. ASV49]MDL9981358.1 HAD-IC family P-type ATPase [Microbacterium sp. ASV49]
MDAATLDGLTTAEVAERVANGETNAFDADTSRTWWSIVRANVFTLFNGIVIACFALLLLLGHWQDALFGFAAIFNTLIGCYQEIRAKIALDRLALLHAPRARVRRDGIDLEVAQGDVVLGDLLVLRAGDQIAADAVVRSARGMQVDESMLTGESDAVDKTPGGEILSGSIVVGGEGLAEATKVGADSYANSFAHEARSFSMMRSELKRSIDRVLTWIGWAIGPVALLVTNSQVQIHGGWAVALKDGSWRDAAVSSIAIIIAMIPLGLVLMTSIAFAVGAARLATQQVLVQELPAVEGLARVDVICLDKTGTLTFGDIGFDADHPLDITRPGVEGWRDALAWFGAAPDANATARSIGDGHPVTRPLTAQRSIPFSSARKWSAVSVAEAPGTWVLGAPSLVFPDAAQIAVEWEGPSAENGEASLADVVRELASQGKRTLVLAHGDAALDDAHVDAERLPQVSPVALVTLVEQVRPDAAQTLSYFAEQGVTVKIISGDNPDTVATIARRVGLEVEEGIDAQTLPDDVDALADVLERSTVFGRVTPDQKKAMVTALQSRGHTVAMTGDGVNDALAIKNADIGIAMESGSAATKAVARLVLLDGQFSHLPGVVAEGRRVTANIERVSMLFLTKTAYATAIALLFGILLLPIPFLPRQLSLTDGLTIGIPAFFLALLPNARRYRPGFLRRSLSFAIPAGIVVGVALTAYSRIAGEAWGVDLDHVRTGATLIVAFLGLWVLVLVSLPFTWIKAVIVAAMVAGLGLALAIPFVANFFKMTLPTGDALTLVWWISGAGIVLIGIVRVIQLSWLRRTDPEA